MRIITKQYEIVFYRSWQGIVKKYDTTDDDNYRWCCVFGFIEILRRRRPTKKQWKEFWEKIPSPFPPDIMENKNED